MVKRKGNANEIINPNIKKKKKYKAPLITKQNEVYSKGDTKVRTINDCLWKAQRTKIYIKKTQFSQKEIFGV
tara:strand:+ start:375 stop:590 length:216 start_codon:yes stop_codon:yes gene_type:complete